MKMRTLIVVTAAVGSIVCLNNPAMAVKPHTQKISQESAQAFCKRHGGGTDCTYQEGDHLHMVHCDKGGKCYNTVNPARKAPSGIGTHVSGTKKSDGVTKVRNKNSGSATAAGKTAPQSKGPIERHAGSKTGH